MFFPAQIVNSFAWMIDSVQVTLASNNVQYSPLLLLFQHKTSSISVVGPVAKSLLSISHVDHIVWTKNVWWRLLFNSSRCSMKQAIWSSRLLPWRTPRANWSAQQPQLETPHVSRYMVEIDAAKIQISRSYMQNIIFMHYKRLILIIFFV